MKFLLLHARITKEHVLLKLEERLSSAVPMMSRLYNNDYQWYKLICPVNYVETIIYRFLSYKQLWCLGNFFL